MGCGQALQTFSEGGTLVFFFDFLRLHGNREIPAQKFQDIPEIKFFLSKEIQGIGGVGHHQVKIGQIPVQAKGVDRPPAFPPHGNLNVLMDRTISLPYPSGGLGLIGVEDGNSAALLHKSPAGFLALGEHGRIQAVLHRSVGKIGADRLLEIGALHFHSLFGVGHHGIEALLAEPVEKVRGLLADMPAVLLHSRAQASEEGVENFLIFGHIVENAVRLFPVSAGAPDFLPVALQVLCQIEMNDVADVLLVDSHAEGVGGDHDFLLPGHEGLEAGLFFLLRKFGVVADGGPALLHQPVTDFVDIFHSGTVDDAGLIQPVTQISVQPLELFPFGGAGLDRQAQILPPVSRVDAEGIFQIEDFHHILLHMGGGGGGKGGDDRPLFHQTDELGDPQIVRAEIIAPEGNAVGLVHHQKTDIQSSGKADEGRGDQPLRRNIEQTVSAGVRVQHDFPASLGGDGTVQAGSRNALCPQLLYLILHQGDQGRDDQRDPPEFHGGVLIAEGFAPAGGHDDRRIPAGQDRADDRFLGGAEGSDGKIFFYVFQKRSLCNCVVGCGHMGAASLCWERCDKLMIHQVGGRDKR